MIEDLHSTTNGVPGHRGAKPFDRLVGPELSRSNPCSIVMPSDDRLPTDIARITILVIEPDIIVRMAVADYLRDCGYHVIEGVAEDDAWAVLKTGQKIDVIFCEVRLNGRTDGFGLARRVRERHPGVDVILASGIPGAVAKAEDLCEDGPLEKPYHPEEIIRRINILIERRRTGPAA
jgi:CheY-like chemotaxis protein